MKGNPMENEIDPGTVVLVAVAELNGIPDDSWIEGDVFDRAVRLDRATYLIELLKERTRDLELSLADSMEEDQMLVPGVGKLTRSEKKSWSWRDGHAGERMREDLAIAVATEVALDVATREVDLEKRNVALEALRVAYDAIPSFSTLKNAGARRLRLKVGDYRVCSESYAVRIDRIGDEG